MEKLCGWLCTVNQVWFMFFFNEGFIICLILQTINWGDSKCPKQGPWYSNEGVKMAEYVILADQDDQNSQQ